MQSSILIRHLLRGSFANATFSYLEKASHAKNFYQKSKCFCPVAEHRATAFDFYFVKITLRGHSENFNKSEGTPHQSPSGDSFP